MNDFMTLDIIPDGSVTRIDSESTSMGIYKHLLPNRYKYEGREGDGKHDPSRGYSSAGQSPVQIIRLNVGHDLLFPAIAVVQQFLLVVKEFFVRLRRVLKVWTLKRGARVN